MVRILADSSAILIADGVAFPTVSTKIWGSYLDLAKHAPFQILSITSFFFDIQRIYILRIKAKEMHNFSYLFHKVLYMFQTGPLSIIRSISILYTGNKYLSC